mmetsp:Transcript_116896/g.342312  ORF Transcript_116896/g.342312 Transcript_116896/m.342312 type:complete len:206 (+) Transcript_116896:822-1439(+)
MLCSIRKAPRLRFSTVVPAALWMVCSTATMPPSWLMAPRAQGSGTRSSAAATCWLNSCRVATAVVVQRATSRERRARPTRMASSSEPLTALRRAWRYCRWLRPRPPSCSWYRSAPWTSWPKRWRAACPSAECGIPEGAASSPKALWSAASGAPLRCVAPSWMAGGATLRAAIGTATGRGARTCSSPWRWRCASRGRRAGWCARAS